MYGQQVATCTPGRSLIYTMSTSHYPSNAVHTLLDCAYSHSTEL